MADETLNLRGRKRGEVERAVERLQWFSDNDVPAFRALVEFLRYGDVAAPIPVELAGRLRERGLLGEDGRADETAAVLVAAYVRESGGVLSLVMG
jgi:hypothetical protein